MATGFTTRVSTALPLVTPPRAGAAAAAAAPPTRGGLVWVTGAAGGVPADLVEVIRTLLPVSRPVSTLPVARVSEWIAARSDDKEDVAIVIAHAIGRGERATHRARAREAGLAFAEIVVTSDWDGLVERTDSTLFQHLAAFFARSTGPDRLAAPPDAVVRVDWHAPHQIRKRIAAALMGAGFLTATRAASAR